MIKINTLYVEKFDFVDEVSGNFVTNVPYEFLRLYDFMKTKRRYKRNNFYYVDFHAYVTGITENFEEICREILENKTLALMYSSKDRKTIKFYDDIYDFYNLLSHISLKINS